MAGLHAQAQADGANERLLSMPFTTIFEYLALLRLCCTGVERLGARAMVVLAAAVSDFYVPLASMSEDKIQSSTGGGGGGGGLTIELSDVPKLLGEMKGGDTPWCPSAYLVSFKLETNENILAAKAVKAMAKYVCERVCANLPPHPGPLLAGTGWIW